MRIILGCLLAALLCLGLQSHAWAASGKALGVEVDARAEGTENRSLTVGADIFIGDRIITDQKGLVQIRFDDETELVVGPNSSLVLEDYLLRNDGSVGKFAVNALAGSFRFVTGTANHDDYLIKTPTGTLAVRGTAFDFFVTAGLTRVIMYSGTTVLCSIAYACVSVASTCEVGQSDSTEAQTMGQAQDTTGGTRDDLRSGFPLADNQGGLMEEFQLDQVPACRLAGPVKPAAANIGDVIGECDPVIGEQYQGDKGRWGECGGSVAALLAGFGRPSPKNDLSVADLVAALLALYQPGDSCGGHATELPQALRLIAAYVTDEGQKASIEEIAATVHDCDNAAPSALKAVPATTE